MTYWQHVKYCLIDGAIGLGLTLAVFIPLLSVKYIQWRKKQKRRKEKCGDEKRNER